MSETTTEAPPVQRREPEGMSRRLATFQPTTFNPETRTCEVVWTTGADVTRRSFWTDSVWVERLLVTSAACDLSRLNSGAPVLNTHGTYDLSDVVGVVERAWITGGEGRATIRFSDREEVAGVVRDVQAGILRNVSVGYWVQEWRITQKSDGTPEIREAVKWQPGEISLVPVPADPGAGVRAAGQPPSTRGTPPLIPEVRMSETTTAPGATAPSATPNAPDPAAVREAEIRRVREEETGRIRGIELAARALGREGDAEALIRDGVALGEAQTRMITAAAAARAAGGTPNFPNAEIIRDAGDTARRGLQDALLHRTGLLINADGTPAALPEHARQFRGFRMREFAAECIILRGGNVRGLAPAEIALAALGQREAMSRAGIGAHSTSDFPQLLANTAAKALGRGYTSARRSFILFATRRTLPDFKTFSVINLGGAPQLRLINEGGEIEAGTLGEGAETYRAFRYGRRIAITFEAIVNDDMDGFTKLPRMFGAAAGRLESDQFYAVFNQNPNMADGNPLFSVAHANVFGSGVAGYNVGDGVLGVTGLGKGMQVFRTQTAPNGDIVDVEPRYLIVPAGLEQLARQFTSMSYVPAAQGNINPYASALTPIIEPRLTNQAQWYLAASGDDVDTVEYAHVEGMEEPQISSWVDPDTDGVTTKCTHAFGAKATEWRGMARSTGA